MTLPCLLWITPFFLPPPYPTGAHYFFFQMMQVSKQVKLITIYSCSSRPLLLLQILRGSHGQKEVSFPIIAIILGYYHLLTKTAKLLFLQNHSYNAMSVLKYLLLAQRLLSAHVNRDK